MVEYQMPTNRAYDEIISDLSTRRVRASRAGDMREMLGVTVRSEDPRQRWRGRRKFNLPFALQETFAYWQGLNPGHVERYNSNMQEWLVDGELPGSAYGDRLRNTAGHDQLERVEAQLRDSPDTRRAVAQVFQAGVEDFTGGDVSCTTELQFLRRDGELHLIARVRSQDMFWGYVYDTQNNQWLQEVLAGRLGLEVGEYVHHMGSCHYYEDFAEAVIRSKEDEVRRWPSPDLRLPVDEHDSAMSALSEGLSAARDGDEPWEVHRLLRGRANDYYADQLAVTTAYEQGRFHDDEHQARQWAQMVSHQPFGSWLVRWLEGRQF